MIGPTMLEPHQVLFRAVTTCRGPMIRAKDLPPEIGALFSLGTKGGDVPERMFAFFLKKARAHLKFNYLCLQWQEHFLNLTTFAFNDPSVTEM